MIQAGQIIDDLCDILEARNDDPMKERIWRKLNYEYFEAAREVSWEDLRARPATLDFGASGVTATGLWLPSDVYGIDLVWDEDNEVEFMEKGEAASQPDEWGYRFFRYLPSRAHLFEGTDLVLEKGGSSFTSAELTADGEDPDEQYVQFDDEPGYYEISSSTTPFTFTPTYHGEKKTSKNFIIRPWQSTKKMVIIDRDEEELLDREVKVYYWRAPVPLYREEDLILFPSVEFLKLRVLRGIPEAKAKFPVSERMLNSAFSRAKAQNPRFPRVFSPRDKHNQRFDQGSHPFATR